jgi:uncharacterized protein YjbJ (UPF0337 family)
VYSSSGWVIRCQRLDTPPRQVGVDVDAASEEFLDQGVAVQIPRIDPKNALGLLDKVVGLGKEIFGSLTNQDRLTKAGQVQQDKGTERIKALQAQLEADAHRTKAAAAGRAQKSAQDTKEAVNN